MTNTKFRKRALLSSVAMLLVALVALGSATFAWFTNSPTANANGLKLKSTASAGIVVRSDSVAKAGKGFAKTTYLNANAEGTAADETAIILDPASVVEINSTSKAPVLASTKSDNPGVSRSGNEAITAVSYSSDATNGPTTAGIFAEKVYIQSTNGEETDVYVSHVNITVATPATTKQDVKAAVYALVVDEAGKVLYHGNSSAQAPTRHLNTTTGTFSSSAEDTSVVTAAANAQLTNKVDGTSDHYVWVILYLDGENDQVFTQNVDASDLISSVDVEFHTGVVS